MKRLFPSFADPDSWRRGRTISDADWRMIRESILTRDDHACRYCGFKVKKWQIVHHIDGNPDNNGENNLETVCPMCNLICHSGQGCVVQGIVDLYEESDYPQNLIITITRRMRARGKCDEQIITYLGLRGHVPFMMSRSYLRSLYGFVTSRKAPQDQTLAALDYGYKIEWKKTIEMNRRLSDLYGLETDEPVRPRSTCKAALELRSVARAQETVGYEGWEDAAEEFYRTTTKDTGEPFPMPELPPPDKKVARQNESCPFGRSKMRKGCRGRSSKGEARPGRRHPKNR